MPTILFVDEEKCVHKALHRSFHKMRDEWEMRFASNPADAPTHAGTDVPDSDSIDAGIDMACFHETGRLADLNNRRRLVPAILKNRRTEKIIFTTSRASLILLFFVSMNPKRSSISR